ncbi:MAG: NADPH:quinone reductase [Betaproteobacteria bacterium]|nr:NADPH:quinone reductase [Betaproteobacteria bacterium]
MKAVWYEKKGPAAAVLRHGDFPDPEPGPGEVRVKVHVSAVNPTDTKARGGWGGNVEMAFARIIPHQDGSGVIDRAGPGVSPARVGEAVWLYEAQLGRASGTAAEYVCVPSENAVRLPDGVSFETGACLGVPAMTAHRCLFQDGGIQGQTVLVAGGGGAVGHAAILLAKWAGARVVTTVSRAEQEETARAAGADLVVNRKSEDVAARVKEFTRGAGVDRVIEVAFEANLDLNRAVLKPNGVISTYSSGLPDSAPRFVFSPVMRQGLTMHFVLVYVMPREAHWAAAREVNAALEAGRYRPHVARVFALQETVAAHEAQESGNTVGKILIAVAR